MPNKGDGQDIQEREYDGEIQRNKEQKAIGKVKDVKR